MKSSIRAGTDNRIAELEKLMTMLQALVLNGFEVTLTPEVPKGPEGASEAGISLSAKCVESGGYLSERQLNEFAELVGQPILISTQVGNA